MPSDLSRMERLISYLEAHPACHLGTRELAAIVGVSERRLHQLCQEFLGLSPGRLQHYLSVDLAQRLLDGGWSVLEASYQAGLSGPGRLHEQMVSLHAVSPGEYKAMGSRLTIRYAFCQSPFGRYLLALTERGVCALQFCLDLEDEAMRRGLQRDWPEAETVLDPVGVGAVAERIFGNVGTRGERIALQVRGTNFQVKVWEALMAIPPGSVVSYSAVARAVGQPQAQRAVGSAVGANPVSWLIPCHRVIRNSGLLGGYRWGLGRKRLMLAAEFGRSELSATQHKPTRASVSYGRACPCPGLRRGRPPDLQ